MWLDRTVDLLRHGSIFTARARRGRSATDGRQQDTRSGRRSPREGSVLARVAAHRGPDGELLDAHTAGVELLNVLRPTVAVARFAAFGALALAESPEWARRLAQGWPTGGARWADRWRRPSPTRCAACTRSCLLWRRWPRGTPSSRGAPCPPDAGCCSTSWPPATTRRSRQDLGCSWGRVPALPRSGVVIAVDEGPPAG